ncbi:MAG TPA: hypothetical protein VN461_03225 [Vicinamibacteria bacterium]|nr:hypothetical protein [Vicinamibacteria bacterium]
MSRRVRFGLVMTLALPAAPAPAADPIVLFGGRVTLGGEVNLTFAPEDDGYFNYDGYRNNTLRRARLGVAAGLRAGDHLALVTQVLSDNLGTPRIYALYLRAHPWKERSFDIQVGRIPPVFGAFPREGYGPDRPLVGYPLAYQYLTSLRPDAAPASADGLLAMRGRGWLTQYPIGSPAPANGLPLVDADRWDTGFQVRVGSEPLEASAAVTQGTLSDPRFSDNNDGKQLSGRLAWRPLIGLVVGVSGARGPYLSKVVQQAAGGASGSSQTAWGLDLEYSRDYWLFRVEAVGSAWDVPVLRPPLLHGPVRALGLDGEARYKIAPGLYVAARLDHLGFSTVEGSAGPRSWDAPVWRVEGGLGYSVRRDLLFKLVYQHNWKDGGPLRSQGFLAAQLLFWL